MQTHPDALVPRATEHVAVPHRQHTHVVVMPLQRLHALQRFYIPDLRSTPTSSGADEFKIQGLRGKKASVKTLDC
eukprot:1147366-Pelagomonas_calceolata.AAC.2